MNNILLIAHQPLANALQRCVAHVFPDVAPTLLCLDVNADASPDQVLAQITALLQQGAYDETLILVDVFGATPCNAAQKMADGRTVRLVAGVNFPMLLRAVTYRHEPLDVLASRAMAGGTQGIIAVVSAQAPQHQTFTTYAHDQNTHHHQQ